MPLKYKKELIIGVVFVPVILALHHAQADDLIIHPAKCLVVPRVRAGPDERGYVHQAEGRELDVQVGGVRVFLRIAHERPPDQELPGDEARRNGPPMPRSPRRSSPPNREPHSRDSHRRASWSSHSGSGASGSTGSQG
jgi:hypothetical protein